MDWPTEAAHLGVSIVVAIITAVVTVRLALRRFYAESWWTRKYEAYHAVLESLHHIREYTTTHLAFADRPPDPRNLELPKEAEEKLKEQLQAAMAELRKQFNVGSFLLCAEAVTVLKRFMLRLDESRVDDWIKYLKLKLDAVDECLGHMRRIASTDLKAAR
jgi:hypothetical protein